MVALSGRARRTAEDTVVRHQRQPQVHRGRCDASVGVVLSLSERMAGPLARDAEGDVRVQQRRAGPGHLGATDVVLRPAKALGTPVPTAKAVTDLGEEATPGQNGPVELYQRSGGAGGRR